MRNATIQFLEKQVHTVSCRNTRAAGVILDGQPVYYNDFGTANNFGTEVVLFNDATAQIGLTVGIAKWQKTTGIIPTINGAAVGDVFEAICYGFTDAIVTLRTRATSTDTWATIVGIAVGDVLAPETLGNNLTRVGTLPSTGNQAIFVAAQSIVSQATAASGGTLTGGASNLTVDTVRMKILVRAM